MTLNSRRIAAQQELIDASIMWAALDQRMTDFEAEGIDDVPDDEIIDLSFEWLQASSTLRQKVDALLALQLETPGKVKAPWPKPETSQEAAAYMAQYVEKPLGQIWLVIARAYRLGSVGLTCEQVEYMTGIRHTTASARVNQLRDTGWIRASGVRRRNVSGRSADVYTPTAFGLESAAKVKGWGWTGEPR